MTDWWLNPDCGREEALRRYGAVEQLVEDALANAAQLLTRGCDLTARQDFELAKRVSSAIEPRVCLDANWDWYLWKALHRTAMCKEPHWTDARHK